MSTTSQPTGPTGKPGAAGQDDRVDSALDDTFPASDPPSLTPETGTGGAAGPDAAGEPDSLGVPSSDRHESERAAGRQDGAQPPEHKTH